MKATEDQVKAAVKKTLDILGEEDAGPTKVCLYVSDAFGETGFTRLFTETVRGDHHLSRSSVEGVVNPDKLAGLQKTMEVVYGTAPPPVVAIVVLDNIGKEDDVVSQCLENIHKQWPSAAVHLIVPDDGKSNDIAPVDLKTSQFEPFSILYNRDCFVVARGAWKDDDRPGFACRWHVPGEIGYPNGFGRPQWMKLPNESHEVTVDKDGNLRMFFNNDPNRLQPGRWVYCEDIGDWVLLCWVNMCRDQAYAMGLGKSGSFAIKTDAIGASVVKETEFQRWHKDDTHVWLTAGGEVTVTTPAIQTDSAEVMTQTGSIYLRLTAHMRPWRKALKMLSLGEDRKTWALGSQWEYVGFFHQLTGSVHIGSWTAEEIKERDINDRLDDMLLFLSDGDIVGTIDSTPHYFHNNQPAKFIAGTEKVERDKEGVEEIRATRDKSGPWDVVFGDEYYYPMK